MTRLTKLALFSWIATLVFVTIEPSAPAAEQLRLRRTNGEDRDSRQTVRTHRTHQTTTLAAVRLEGTIQYDQRRGLTINGAPILIDRITSLCSERFTEFPPPKRLDGAEVTLFGVATHRGIRATLIMDRTQDSVRSKIARAAPDVYIRPSAHDSRVGTYVESAPR